MRPLLLTVCLMTACDVSRSPDPAVVPEPEPNPAPAAVPEVEPPAEPEPPAVAEPSRPLSVVELEPSAGPLAQQLRYHAKRGATSGRRVVLEMGAPWCPPCRRAKALLARESVASELTNVVVLRANSDVWGADLDALGFDAPVIPVYYRLDADGGPSGDSARGDRWSTPEQVRSGLLAFLRGG